ncbi:DNA-binding transcriptional regulator GbsR (MarR family) [Ulvibacter sp. MAR_2010_11]|uniref:GbsR/MarR family transcriptional regulator n=1 Tax=Ulvibacter sp. MAR_2010_11 TaxID=1250229 RepID=UPI000C2BBEAA|nr:transcriptional regulator [Ulvibacter sp. MAR_2010_11]PKA81936.1 DNA-binding transcriptional regulator GbsR (MarR family) [Ulvibacter sp. MAR_2010_11]
MKIQLTHKQQELVESFGVIQEQMGLPPASARVNSLLTVANETELTFDEIRETLQLSKSATSNAINSLLSLDRIGYKTKTGDRKRYFFSKLDQWKSSFRKDISGLSGYNEVMKEILLNRSPKTKEYNAKIKELTLFMDYFMKESIKLIDNWNKR